MSYVHSMSHTEKTSTDHADISYHPFLLHRTRSCTARQTCKMRKGEQARRSLKLPTLPSPSLLVT